MNICFLARPSFDVYSTEIYKKLKMLYKGELNGFFITSNDKETKYVKDRIPEAKVFETSSYLRKNWNSFNLERFIAFEKKYDCEPIWKYIYTDRFLIHRDYNYVIKITVGLFAFFEEIFSRNKINFYFSECVSTLQCYVAFLVGKKYNTRYLAQMCARGGLDSTYHYIVSDEYQHNLYFDNDYKNKAFSNDEWQFAEKYLINFEQVDSPPPIMKLIKSLPTLDKNFWLAPFRYIKLKLSKYSNDPYSYMYYKNYKEALKPVKYYINYLKSKKYYHSADYSKKYIYFPLHFQPESTTCVCAQKYEKQLFFIDSLAKSIPSDTIIYVKEHYAHIGHRDPQFYIELKNYPNVVLINPFESSRKLIENAVVVSTLTGTAGMEAMLLRKPVIMCGEMVFDNAPGIIKINDIYNNYISALNNWIKPSREDVIKYLCACIRTYRKGDIHAQNYHQLLKDNIDDLCHSLLIEINKVSSY